MKKIFSIVLALGLVLGMTLASLPVGAQYGPDGEDWTVVTVAVDPTCELELAKYTISFDITADLHSGHDWIEICFPGGTAFPEGGWLQGHATINGDEVFAGDFLAAGNCDHGVRLIVPDGIIPVGAVEVIFDLVFDDDLDKLTGLRNPVQGLYFVYVKTSRTPNNTLVQSGWNAVLDRYVGYRISPAFSTYNFWYTFGATWSGLPWNFAPPLAYCNTYTVVIDLEANTPYGCYEYDPVEIRFWLESGPAGGVVSLNMTDVYPAGPWYDFTLTDDTKEIWGPAGGFPVGPAYWGRTYADVHFSKIGEYTICFEAKFLGDDDPRCPEDPKILAEMCVDIVVHQVMDADFLWLDEKWNLISLPIVPYDTSIASILAPLHARAWNLVSVWHYDAIDDEWFAFGQNTNITTLEHMEDGKGYWVRMRTWDELYDILLPIVGPIMAPIFTNAFAPPKRLWVFGTPQPQPPASPSAYDVATGWNMVGITTTDPDVVAADYLAGTAFTKIYGYDPGVPAGTWVEDPVDLDKGQGYWIAFTEPGMIHP